MAEITFRRARAGDYDQLYALWKGSPGVGLSSADSRKSILRYLRRNRGNSFVALSGTGLVGSILAGSDGRRGYLHHLVVHPDYRRMGIGRTLVEKAVGRLGDQGIEKCHIFIFSDNEEGKAFWRQVGWEYRVDIAVMSRNLVRKGKMSVRDTERTC